MSVSSYPKSQGYKLVSTRELEGGAYKLEKLMDNARTCVVLILKPIGARSGEYFGGHRWEELAQAKSILGEIYDRIKTEADFRILSHQYRESIGSIVDEQNDVPKS